MATLERWRGSTREQAAPIAFRKVSYRFCELDGLAA